jgi:hypothetical protein
MKRAPRWGIDLGVYVKAVPLLVRNPSIVVVPLLMAVASILVTMVLAPAGGGLVGYATGGITGLILILLELFGLGVACIIADDAWRHGRASFDKGWTQASARAGQILYTALGITMIFAILQYAMTLLPFVALALMAVAVFFLIWAIPGSAVGGLGGADAIQVSIDRVRANLPLAAVTAVVVALASFAAGAATVWMWAALAPYAGGSGIVDGLIGALVQAIANSYIALIITKTYTDASFTRRW